eukprot:5863449-Prymnesium_polylepis.2
MATHTRSTRSTGVRGRPPAAVCRPLPPRRRGRCAAFGCGALCLLDAPHRWQERRGRAAAERRRARYGLRIQHARRSRDEQLARWAASGASERLRASSRLEDASRSLCPRRTDGGSALCAFG